MASGSEVVRVPVTSFPSLTPEAWAILREPEVVHLLEDIARAEREYRLRYLRLQMPFWPCPPQDFAEIGRRHERFWSDLEAFHGESREVLGGHGKKD